MAARSCRPVSAVDGLLRSAPNSAAAVGRQGNDSVYPPAVVPCELESHLVVALEAEHIASHRHHGESRVGVAAVKQLTTLGDLK